jgi:hypothetical protein
VYTAQPVGAASEGERMEMVETVLPVRERREGMVVGRERTSWVVESRAWTKAEPDSLMAYSLKWMLEFLRLQ